MDHDELCLQLRQAYTALDIPADTLLTDPILRERFANHIRQQTGEVGLATDDLLRRLLRLRKAGQLPRLRRSAGRDPHSQRVDRSTD